MPHLLPRIHRIVGILVLIVTLPLGISACDSSDAPSSPDTSNADTPTSPDALRSYYESRIDDLNQTLLNERQEAYISRRHYEDRIAELESRLEAENQPASPSPDISVSLIQTEQETTPPLPTAAFRYTLHTGSVAIDTYIGTLQIVTIPAAITALPVTRIEDDAFRGTAVTEVTIPESVTEIGWFAFADCISLQTVTLPASVTSIAYGAFDGCPHITLLCPADSYAASYAQSFGLSYQILP